MRRRIIKRPPPPSGHVRLPSGVEILPPDERGLQKHLQSSLDAMPVPLNRLDVPVDLREREIKEYKEVGPGGMGPLALTGQDLINEYLKRITAASEMIASTLILRRGLNGRSFAIGTTAVSIARAEYLRGYIFLNPAASVGLTTFRTVKALAIETVDGNTQSTSIGVANFSSAHFFIDVTDTDGGATTLEVFLQAFDPLSGNWVDTQLLLTTTATGSFYAPTGDVGIVTDMAIRWTITGGTPSATFSVGMVLKGGLAGSSASGLAQTIYLGPEGVTTSNGFPLLEGQSKAFFLKEGVELFAIGTLAGLSLRVFEL